MAAAASGMKAWHLGNVSASAKKLAKAARNGLAMAAAA